jgi:hypothetical protein
VQKEKINVPHLFHSKTFGLRVLFDATNQRLHTPLSGAVRLSIEGPSIIVVAIARASQLVWCAAEIAGAVHPEIRRKNMSFAPKPREACEHY